MGDSSRFDFCPKCGALARDGVCQSCGYRNPDILRQMEEGQSAQPVQGAYPDGQGVQPAQGVFTGQAQPCINVVPPAQPAGKGRSHTAVVLVVILSVILVLVVALILVSISILQRNRGGYGFGDLATEQSRERQDSVIEEYEEEYESEPYEPADGEGSFRTSYSHYSYDVTQDNWEEEGQDASYPYYSGPYNALRDDLSYEISFAGEYYFSEQTDNVYIYVEYPQIASDEMDSGTERLINASLYYEYDYFLSLFKDEFKPLMKSEEDVYECVVDSYVTYMDENVLSVVFKEYIYLNLQDDPFYSLGFFCVNFDLETGTVLENTDILRVDEAFAIDFRERERMENGDGALTQYTDQEIMEMLRDPACLVLFYTPMGLEVGLNLDDVVVYVTYADYEEYLNSF